jgi:hypothetical protein
MILQPQNVWWAARMDLNESRELALVGCSKYDDVRGA